MQALSHLCHLLKSNDFEAISGVVSSIAKDEIKADVERNWSDEQRNNIDLEVDEIVEAAAVRVLMHNVAYERYADVDVDLVGLRRPRGDGHPAVVMNFSLRFSRNYSSGQYPIWTVTKFVLKSFKKLQQ